MVDWTSINLLILDVDGVLTDGRIELVESGDLVKSFHAQDGSSIKAWQKLGGKVAVLSGRQSAVVETRARELGIEWVEQGIDEKAVAYERILAAADAADANVCYVGDDLADVPVMRRCAFPVAVRNAVPAVKQIAQYVTATPGGSGAVREVIELILLKQHRPGAMLPER